MRISDWSSDVCSSDLHTQVYRYVGFVRNPVVRPATKSGYSWPRPTSRKFPADPVDAHDPRCNFADVALENVTPRHEREIPRPFEPRVRAAFEEIGRASCGARGGQSV